MEVNDKLEVAGEIFSFMAAQSLCSSWFVHREAGWRENMGDGNFISFVHQVATVPHAQEIL